MKKLLFVKASPQGAASKSNQVADAYLTALRTENPNLELDTLPLWETELPTFDGIKVAAKVKVVFGQEHDIAERAAWDQIAEIADRFIAADRYLFAVPMWNSGIPYRLKHYIDVIHQPSLLWGVNRDTGYFGLLKHKHATLVLTSGVYAPNLPSPAFGVDHHAAYLRAWLEQAGVTAIDEIRFEPTQLTSDPEGEFARAKEEAVRLARTHGSI